MEPHKNDQTDAGCSNVTCSQIEIVDETGKNQMRPQSEWIRLNVGGKLFITTRYTLTKDPDTLLFDLLQETSKVDSQKDQTGAYKIARDPIYFEVVFNYLRHGKLMMDKNLSAKGVLEEAKFFNIKKLVVLVEEKLRQRDLNDIPEEWPKTHPNYTFTPVWTSTNPDRRVLQCQYDELKKSLSTLPEGWKLEHVEYNGRAKLPYSLTSETTNNHGADHGGANHDGANQHQADCLYVISRSRDVAINKLLRSYSEIASQRPRTVRISVMKCYNAYTCRYIVKFVFNI